MFEKNQFIGNYSIKRVLAPDGVIQKYLSEDPFFNTSVTLNVLDVRSLSQEQKHTLFSHLQKIFTLEHDAVLTVFDSGFESDYVFFTNARDHKCSLLKKIEEGLLIEETLKALRHIVSALKLASEKHITNGPLTIHQVYFEKNNQPIIENFGIKYYFSAVKNNIDLDYSFKNIISDIDEIFSNMKSSSKIDSSDSKLVRELDEFSDKLKSENSFNDFNEILKSIDTILSNFSVASKDIENIHGETFNINNREDVLPFIRSVIEERNKLKIDLVESEKVNNDYNSKLLRYDKIIENIKEDNKRIIKYNEIKNRRISYVAVFFSFILGIFFTNIYNRSFTSDEVEMLNNSLKAENKIQKEKAIEDISNPVDKNENDEIQLSITPVTVVDKTDVLPQEPSLELQVEDKEVQLIQESADWLPPGQEFQDAVSPDNAKNADITGISDNESEALFTQIIGWAGAWERQDIESYLAYYSNDFIPGGGASLADWKKLRKSRLTRPEWIKVQIQNIVLQKISESEVKAEFQQTYISDTFKDEGKKVIHLLKQGNAWLIGAEKSL